MRLAARAAAMGSGEEENEVVSARVKGIPLARGEARGERVGESRVRERVGKGGLARAGGRGLE